jgi:flagellar basal-body rod protein FlgC
MIDPIKTAIKVSGTGIEAQSRRMLVVSENLANVYSTGTTPGAEPYRRKTISFAAELDQVENARFVKVDRVDVDRAPFRVEHDPNHPAADANGYVKLPNVDMMVELADMREANRSYEANVQMVKQSRALSAMMVDLLRS